MVDARWEVQMSGYDPKCNNKQRCNLLSWQYARKLEDFLKKSKFDEGGILHINKTMLDQEAKISMKLSIFDKKTKQLQNDSIQVTINNPNQKKDAIGLQIIIPELVFEDMQVHMKADVGFCGEPPDNWEYHWTIFHKNSTLVQELYFKKAQATINLVDLRGAKEFIINCSVRRMPTNTTLASDWKILGVQGREPFVIFTTKMITIGENQAFTINAYTRPDEAVHTWSCIYKERPCQNFSSPNGPKLDNLLGFSDSGTYTIILQVRQGNKTSKDMCTVVVVKGQTLPVEILEIDQPIIPTVGVDITARISLLRTGCILKWSSPTMNNFEQIDLNLLGQPSMLTYILKEDRFLQEFDDFSQEIVEKEFTLKIPPKSGKWAGLKTNSNYVFMLNVSCPETYKFQNSYTLTALSTSTLPMVGELMVNPQNGTAFTTKFVFSTKMAVSDNKPVVYKFGYIFKKNEVEFCEITETPACDGTLPYQEGGIKTYLEVCDNQNACNLISGPVVPTLLQAPSKKEIMQFYRNFDILLLQEDYEKAFNNLIEFVAALKTTKQEESANEVQTNSFKSIQEKIRKLVNESSDSKFWKIRSNDLTKSLRILLGEFSIPQSVLNEIVTLRSKLSKINASKLEHREATRSKRQMDDLKKSKTMHENLLEDVQNILEVSELIIMSSEDKEQKNVEKEHLRTSLEHYLSDLCVEIYKKPRDVELEMKTVMFALEKLSKNSVKGFFVIPYEFNNWNVTGRVKLDKKFADGVNGDEKLCLGKVVFKDYFKRYGYTYLAKIFSGNGETDIETDNNIEATIILNVYNVKPGKKLSCIVWNDSWIDCTTIQKSENMIRCSCPKLGYFSLKYTTIPKVSVQEITTTVMYPNTTIVGIKPDTEHANFVSVTTKRLDPTDVKIPTKTTAKSSTSTLKPTTAKTHDENNQKVLTNKHKSTNQEISKAGIQENEVLSYVLIGLSSLGIIILIVVSRRYIRSTEDVPQSISKIVATPKYARLFDETGLRAMSSK